jgi:hypothetical protein
MGAYPIDALFALLNLHLPSHVPFVPDEYLELEQKWKYSIQFE